ncbi:MAG: phosphoesterase, partial [Candidatus Aenigmatarchaeota archaeon]
PKLLERTVSLVIENRLDRVVILGDVKHRVPGLSFQEEREVPHFLNALSKEATVEIVPGNHDCGLRKLVPKIKMHKSSGFMLDDVYLMHGQTWPSKDFLDATHVMMGHNHPLVGFWDKLGYVWRERVWVKAGLVKSRIEAKYGSHDSMPRAVIMPAYNDMTGGRALNSKDDTGFMGPIGGCIRKSSTEIYMLDGTHIGKLSGLRKI